MAHRTPVGHIEFSFIALTRLKVRAETGETVQ